MEREGLCQLAMLLATQLGEESKGMVGALQPLLLTLAKDPGVKLTERTMVCAVVSTLTLSSLFVSVVVCVTFVCVPVPGLQCIHTLGLCLYLAVDDPRVRVGQGV